VRATRSFHSGTHPTLKLATREGFELTGTHNHPVLCLEAIAGVPVFQWRLLSEIEPGTKVAISRGTPETPAADEAGRQLGLLAGALVSEGFASPQRAGFNNTDKWFFDDVVEAYDAIVGGPRYLNSRTLPSGRTLHELDIQNLDAYRASPLDEMIGLNCADKQVPDFVWAGTAAIKRAFLQALFEGDGSFSILPRRSIQICYSTLSGSLASGVQRLLLEFGVISRLARYSNGETKVVVTNRRDARAFASNVGFHDHKQSRLRAQLLRLPLASRSLSHDHIPYLAEYIRSEAKGAGRVWLTKHNIDRVERWEQYGDLILEKLTPEVRSVVEPVVEAGYYYATVESVADAGRQPVYSLRVDSDDHAFITDGFVSHNTECRLSPIAMSMVDGIDENTVDFLDNFDGQEEEPWVLPARFPNLLVNGGQGIAVGMASNIPPHNLGEVIDATTHLIDNPDAPVEELMEIVKGPDFPTGGVILGRGGIQDAYRTGRGSIKVRAVAEIEESAKGGDRIVVTEIPYQTSVEAIETKAAELVNNKDLEGIRDIRNESAKGQTRLVFELKRDAPALVTLNNLYKHTPLQTNFAVNMVALVDGVPRTLNLREALIAYIDHQVEVVTRRTQFRLAKAEARAHIVEGLVKALDMIDAIVALIRASQDRAAALEGLIGDGFEFSEIQANHILDMQLHRLTQLGRSNLEDELAQLRETIKELNAILDSPEKLRGVIKTEMGEIRDKHAGERKSVITFDPGDLNIEDLIDDEDLVVTMTAKGYLKTVAAGAFRTQGRGGRGVAGAKLRDEDYVSTVLATTAHAYLLFFSNRGRVYRLKAHEIPMKERTARGTAIVNLLQLQPDEKIQAIIDTRDYETNRFLFFATKKGQVKKTKFTEYDSSLRTGLIAINLKEGDELVKVMPTNGEDDIFIVSKKGQAIRFSEGQVRPMGRSAAGVRGMKLKSDDEVVSCDVAYDDCTLLVVTDAGYGKRTQLDKFKAQGRGGQGVRAMKLTQQKGAVVASFMVHLDEEIFVIATGGVVIRMPVRQISSQGRDATGVKVMNLEEGQFVASVAPVLQADDEDE
jgi:DNA gyrase subunit A